MSKKKTNKNEINNDLDFSDLDGLDDDIDFGKLEDIEDDRKPSKTQVAKELGKEATAGFFDGLIKKTAKKTLPDEYDSNYYEAMDYADFAKETFDVNKSKLNKSVFRLGKEVKKILPFQFKTLDNYLEKYQSDYEEQKQVSEDQMRESSIQSNVSSVFDKQLEIQKAIEARKDARDEVESKERISNNKMNVDILSNIDSSASNLSAFTLQISKEYYRKSLELQYKSYFIQADMLKTMRDHYKAFSIQFDNIVKNTGLPEFVKLNNTERISDIFRTQAIQNVNKNLFSNNEYIKSVKSKMSKMVGEKVSNITDGIGTVTDQLGMINSAGEMGGGGARVLAGVGSGLLGSTIGEKLSDKISPKLKEKFKDNKAINTGANYLSMLSKSPSTLFGTLRNKASKKEGEYADEGTPGRFIASKLFGGLNELLSVTEPGKKEYNVTSASSLNHNKPAIFDNKTHRSITEVIPMYLAKILNENTNLTQSYKFVNSKRLKKGPSDKEELTYDYDGRSLTTTSKLKDSIQKNILDSTGSKNKLSNTTNSLLGGSINELSKDKNANKDKLKILQNKKADKLLNEYLRVASKDESITFDYKTLINNYSENIKLKELVDKNPELGKVLDLIKEAKVDKNRTNIDSQLSDVKRVYPITTIKELFTNTSMLARKKIKNVIKDDAAEVIAKCFTRFITDAGRDINITNIVNGECFKFLPKKDLPLVENNITIFINEVKIINVSDSVVESSLGVLLSAVNYSMKSNFELDPEVFQTLHELNPAIVSKGKLSIENLVERKLTSAKENEYISLEDIRKNIKTPKDQIEKVRVQNATMNMFDSIINKSKDFKDELSEAGSNPFAIARVVVKNAKKASDSVRASSNKAFETASKKLDSLKDSLGKLTDETIESSLNKLVKKFDEAEIAIDEMIKKESLSRDEELKSLSEAKDKFSEVINDNKSLKEIDESIVKVNKYYDTSIKTMTSLKKIIGQQKSSMILLKESGSANRLELVKKIRTEIESTLNKVRGVLEKAEKTEVIPA